jgi:hypothetical protein
MGSVSQCRGSRVARNEHTFVQGADALRAHNARQRAVDAGVLPGLGCGICPSLILHPRFDHIKGRNRECTHCSCAAAQQQVLRKQLRPVRLGEIRPCGEDEPKIDAVERGIAGAGRAQACEERAGTL